MVIRSNTSVFTFDPASPRIFAHDTHEWLHEEMHIQEQKIQMIQIDGIKQQQWRTQEFCSGGGVQQIQLRTEERENRYLGTVALYSGVLEAAVIWYKKFYFM